MAEVLKLKVAKTQVTLLNSYVFTTLSFKFIVVINKIS